MGHYTGRGVMKFYENGDALAKDMGVAVSVLEETHEAHYQAAKKTEKDPSGGSWPAYPSGKSWDEASGKTGSGKEFYHNIIPGSAVKTEPFYVAIITPVIHYCMGGLEIDCDSAVLGPGGKAMLDCVVFGRVSAIAACKWMFGAQDEFRLCPIPKELKELTKRFKSFRGSSRVEFGR